MSSRSLVFLRTWIRKEVVRNLRWQTRWILESNGWENAAEFQRFRSSDIPMYHSLGERTTKKQRRRKDNNSLQRKYGQYWVAPPDGHLRQSAQSLQSSSGHYCRTASWSESPRETRCIRSAGQTRNSYTTSSRRLASKWRATGRDCQKTRSYPDNAPKQVWDQSKLNNSSLLSRHQEEKQINLYVENKRCLEIKKEQKWKDGSKAMYDLDQSRAWKFAMNTEDTVLKSKFNLCSKIKPNLGPENVNGIDKFVREAMPIQEEETASVRPTAKARPNAETVINKQSEFYSDKAEKFGSTTQSKSLSWSWCRSPLRPKYWWMQEKAIRRYRILVRRDDAALRQCSVLVNCQMVFSSGKRSRTEEKVSLLREPRNILRSSCTFEHPRTFREYHQSCIARHCTVTWRF